MQDDDPEGYEEIPEVLRSNFNRIHSHLFDFLRNGEHANREKLYTLFRMYRISQLNPRNTTKDVLSDFSTTLEKTEQAMNGLIQYLDDSEKYVDDRKSIGKLSKLKKHVPNWDDLSVEEQSKAIATLVNAKII